MSRFPGIARVAGAYAPAGRSTRLGVTDRGRARRLLIFLLKSPVYSVVFFVLPSSSNFNVSRALVSFRFRVLRPAAGYVRNRKRKRTRSAALDVQRRLRISPPPSFNLKCFSRYCNVNDIITQRTRGGQSVDFRRLQSRSYEDLFPLIDLIKCPTRHAHKGELSFR